MNDRDVKLELNKDEAQLLLAIIQKAQIIGELAPVVSSILGIVAAAVNATGKKE